MKLKINPKWKYISQDEDKDTRLYVGRPCQMTTTWQSRDGSLGIEDVCGPEKLFLKPDLGPNWKDSLHEILEDGTLKKVKEEKPLQIDDKVWVRNSEDSNWLAQHFAGWGGNETILVYDYGRTSHSIKHVKTPGNHISTYNYWTTEDPTKKVKPAANLETAFLEGVTLGRRFPNTPAPRLFKEWDNP